MMLRQKYFKIFSDEKEKQKNITTNFANEDKCGCENRTLDNLIIKMEIP